MTEEFDVVVIGGGPAGATTAGLLAKAGRRVLVLEKEKFPRYHIGESFVPGLNPVIDELGFRDVMDRAGFTQKYGISLLWGAHRDVWTVYWGDAGPYDYTWQVKRAEFDHLLLEHVRRLGALVVEEASVRDVLMEDGRCVGVTYRCGDDTVHEVRARYVVDASGQAKLLARKLNLVEWYNDLRNIAIWTYYQGGRHFEGKDAGNILVENHPDGWMWVIPFSDGTRSVGFVGPSDRILRAGQKPAEIFEEKLANSREAKSMLADAVRVGGYRTTRDWSYTSSSFVGPGWLLVGDAAAFIDPLFSTGVTLAMKGGSSAAATLTALLDEPEREQEYLAVYDDGYRRFLENVVSFVRYFYDASRDVEAYWAEAGRIVDPLRKMASRQDFILMVSALNAARAVLEPHPAVNSAPAGIVEASRELIMAAAGFHDEPEPQAVAAAS